MQKKKPVNFILAGEILTAQQYADKLSEICRAEAVEPDRYGEGGCVAALESRFEAATGKEKAIFMPPAPWPTSWSLKCSADKI